MLKYLVFITVPCSKITRSHLGLIRDGGGFPWSLDFFASFLGQAKNDEQLYNIL